MTGFKVTAPGVSLTGGDGPTMDQLTAAIGKVTVAWNQTQLAVALIFQGVTQLNGPLAEAIFYSLRSDRQQREMTLVAAAVTLAEDAQLLSLLKRLLGEVDRLSSERNAATHSTWAINVVDQSVSPIPGKTQHPKLRPEFMEQFGKLAADLDAVTRDLFMFRVKLLKGDEKRALAVKP